MSLPQIIVYGRGDKPSPEYTRINITSHSKEEWSKSLSPFFLGPVEVEPFSDQIYTANIFENAWQYLKRYPSQNKEGWLSWAKEGWTKEKAVRFPMGRGAKPMYAYWRGESLGYIEARFKIYAPLYEKCVENYADEAFQRLASLVKKGEKIALFDYDGYYHYGAGKNLVDVIYNPKRKMGHGFVLLGMLSNDYFWREEYDESKILPFSVKRLL